VQKARPVPFDITFNEFNKATGSPFCTRRMTELGANAIHILPGNCAAGGNPFAAKPRAKSNQ
jgi:hypothetical protein